MSNRRSFHAACSTSPPAAPVWKSSARRQFPNDLCCCRVESRRAAVWFGRRECVWELHSELAMMAGRSGDNESASLQIAAQSEPFRCHGALRPGDVQGLWGLVSTPAEYRQRAAECLRLSGTSNNPEVRAILV